MTVATKPFRNFAHFLTLYFGLPGFIDDGLLFTRAFVIVWTEGRHIVLPWN